MYVAFRILTNDELELTKIMGIAVANENVEIHHLFMRLYNIVLEQLTWIFNFDD